MVKAAKPKAKKVARAKSSSSTSSSSSSSSSSAVPLLNCSPPALTNGAKKCNSFLLNPDEQVAYKKYISEIKQVSALVLLKCGLGVQECKVISQKMQEDYLFKNYEKVYTKLTQDVIIGRRVTAVPLRFLCIGTSRSKEILSGSTLRKRYSAMKSYMNNTLSPLWRK